MEITQETGRNIKRCYSGYHKDTNTLTKSASGGLAMSLSEAMIEARGIVYGVAYTEDFYGAKFIRVSQKEDLTKLQGSKYIFANKSMGERTVYHEVLNDLNAGNQVLFIGLPCDVGALKSVLNKKGFSETNRLLTVDLICHGPTSPKVNEEYVRTLEKRYNSKIIDFSVRYKNPNWTPPYIRAGFKNGRVFLAPFYDTDYGIAFSIWGRPVCYNCAFKGENHKSDITIGDYWEIKENDPGYNKKGVSIAVVYNQNAEDRLLALDSFEYQLVDIDEALNGNPLYFDQRKPHPKRDYFIQVYQKHGLHKACLSSMNKREIVLRYAPESLIQIIRPIIQTIRSLKKAVHQ